MSDSTVTLVTKADVASTVTRRLQETLDFYLKFHSIEGHTSATLAHYRKELGAFSKFLGHRRRDADVDQTTTMDILTHLQDLKDRGCKPRTIRTRFVAIATFFKWAVEWDMVSKSPASKLKPPKVPKAFKRFLKPEQFDALIAVCPPHLFTGARRRAMLQILATTGMRRKELAQLGKDDLDFHAGVIYVRLGKGQKDRRATFHRDAQRAVLRYLSHRKDELPHLWITEERQPMKLTGLVTDMRRLVHRVGFNGQVEDLFHAFRRTWAADAVRQKIARQYIMGVAGWSSPRMLDHYTQAMQEEEGAIDSFRDFEPFSNRSGVG